MIWQEDGSKTQSWSSFLRRRLRAFSPLRFLVIFIFSIAAMTAYAMYLMTFGMREAFTPEPDAAVKEYEAYLASPQHQSLIYPTENDRAHGKAALIALVRNREVDDMAQSMRELEQTFNHKFNYPWIFFNDEPFTDRFIQTTSALTNAETRYGCLFMLPT
jgi:Glycolipid 2-alpha-mannosyltransferase